MEASPQQQQQQQKPQQGPPPPEQDTHKVAAEQQPNTEISSKHQDVEHPIEPQERHKKPSVEEIVMDVPPHASSSPTQEHHKEPNISPEPHISKPASETNVVNTSPQHHHSELSASQDHHSECYVKSTSTESSSESNVPKPSTIQEDHRKEPSSNHGVIETPSRPQADAPIKGQSVETPSQQASVPTVLLNLQAQHGSDPLQAQEKTETEIKKTSIQPSADVSTPLLLEKGQVELPRGQSTVAITAQVDVEEKHHTTAKEMEASSGLSQQEAQGQQQAGVLKQAEAHGTLTENPTSKISQVVTLHSSQKPSRAEIDTAAPFESVKAAVSLFGERMDWKSQTRPPQNQVPNVERRVLPESELHKVQNDLVYHKDQLALTQASTAGVLLELKKVKRLIQNPASKPGSTEILSHKSLEPVDTLKNAGPNVEFMAILREVESVKEDLISATVVKETAVKGLQDALSSLTTVLKRVDELGGEKKSLDEAVADAHIALADAEEQVALLKSGQKVDSLNGMPSDFMEKKSAEIKGLETKLEEAKAMIASLKEELVVSKSLAVAAASETQQKMVKVKLELDQAKSEELSIVGKLASVLEESDELKAKLEKAVQENATLSSTIQTLKLDIEAGRKELESMHEKEQTACATLASLQDELHRLKEVLRSAQGGEARAIEAKDNLPAAIKQAASEADQAKAAAEASKEEARRARQETEQAKAATSTAISRQQAALKELEAAKASEAMALAELKALTESESYNADVEPESEGSTGVCITLEEYSALKQAAVEAEGLADKKVAVVIAQVEEAKASQEKAQSKLDEIAKEAEKGQEDLNKAQKQVDDALELKLTAEADLRKWRAEHDQRRKSGGAPLPPKAGTLKNPPQKLSEEEKLAAFGSHDKEDAVPATVQGKKTAGRDSLAQVMSLDVPTPERLERVSTLEVSTKDEEKVKKRTLIRRLTAIVALKRKP